MQDDEMQLSMNEQDRGVMRLGFWAVLLFGVFAWAPTTYPGYWEATEGFRPVFNAVHATAIAGVVTEADIWRGTGGAAYLVAQPLMMAGLTPTAAVRATFALAIILGGLGIYGWLRERWGDRTAGLAGLLYMLWPPLLATVYVRGSLSDAVILGLLPMAFAGAAGYAVNRSPLAAATLAVSMFWMWRTQAGLALAATVLLLAYALIVERERTTAAVAALSAAAGFTSLLPLWRYLAESDVDFFEHFVYPHQLLYGRWQTAPSMAGWQDGYPFMLGYAVLAFGVTALWLWWMQRESWSGSYAARMLSFCGLTGLLLVVLSMPISAPLWRVVGADRVFTYPWQMMLLAGPLLAIVAGSLPTMSSDLGKPALWTVLVGVIILAGLPYLTAEFTQVAAPETPLAVYGDASDIVLLDAELTEDDEGSEATLAVQWQVLQTPPFDYSVFFQAIEAKDGDQSVVAQLDVQPLRGENPATLWVPGDIYTDTYTLDLPDHVVAEQGAGSSLRYYFGFYDWRDGARLPVDGGIDDKYVLYGD